MPGKDFMKAELIVLITRVIVAVLCGVVVPAARRWLLEKTENEKLNRVKEWAYTAVSAAEQWYTKKYPGSDPTGDKRRDYARNMISQLCDKHKIDLSANEIDAMIEAAVNEINIFKETGLQAVKTSD